MDQVDKVLHVFIGREDTMHDDHRSVAIDWSCEMGRERERERERQAASINWVTLPAFPESAENPPSADTCHGRRQKFAGGFLAIRQAHKNAHSVPTRGVWGHAPPGKCLISGLLRSFLMHFRSLDQEFHELAMTVVTNSCHSLIISCLTCYDCRHRQSSYTIRTFLLH